MSKDWDLTIGIIFAAIGSLSAFTFFGALWGFNTVAEIELKTNRVQNSLDYLNEYLNEKANDRFSASEAKQIIEFRDRQFKRSFNELNKIESKLMR